MRITMPSVGLLVVFVLGLPFSCVPPCGGGGSPILQITDFEILMGEYSNTERHGISFSDGFDSTTVVQYHRLAYKIEVSEFNALSSIPESSSGFAAYACSPPPRISIDSVTVVEITSKDTLWFNNELYIPGMELNEIIQPNHFTDWSQFYSLSSYELMDYGLEMYVSKRPDKRQLLELNFNVILEDEREFLILSDAVLIE